MIYLAPKFGAGKELMRNVHVHEWIYYSKGEALVRECECGARSVEY